MVTLKDIAEEAGVSVMTVSRVVNGHLEKVSPANVDIIRDIIQRTGYVPNATARSLVSKSSKIIAAIVPGDGTNLLLDPYVSELLGAITLKIQERGFYLMLRFTTNYNDIISSIRTWNVDGAIFLGILDEHMKHIQDETPIPMVFTDSYFPFRQISTVGIDDYAGGVLAAKYFIKNGHQHMAFYNNVSGSGVLNQRFCGFLDTIEAHGLSLPQAYILNEREEEDPSGYILTLDPVPSAIFATSDLKAIRLIEDFIHRGYRVPEDFSVIGFDNIPMSQHLTPKLTTIAQDLNQKASHVVDLLFKKIDDPHSPTQHTVLDVQLIERESVATR